MNDWFTIRAAQTPGIADVAIEGTIQAGDAQRFLSALPRDARTIRLRVTSLGGDPTAAMAIAQALRAHPARVEVTIQKIAASAATLPCMAGNHVTMSADGVGMIHNPGAVLTDTTTPRDARELRAAAVELDRIKDRMLDTYGWRLKGGREAIARLMDDTTWLSPSEALRLGMVDAVGPATAAVTACFAAADLGPLGPIPARFQAAMSALTTGPHQRDRRALASLEEVYGRLNRQATATIGDFYREREEERQRQLAALWGGGR